ncbi:hypothetical protein AAC387_Pa05g3882 [Persea americana]
MNLEPPALPPPPRLSSCHLHPDHPVTGFCASCLRERLAGLDPASNHRNPPPPTAASALKAIFKPSSSKCSFPELRRSKSFSGARADGIPVIIEPQRRSCDVRVRNTLWSLFHQDNGPNVERGTNISREIEQQLPNAKSVNLGFDEVKEEIEEEAEDQEGEIRVEETVVVVVDEEGEGEGEKGDVKTMKDHIDLDAQMNNQTVEKRDLKEIAGSFWLAASVLSKKLQKWRRKKKRRSGREFDATTAEKPLSSSRHFRETQSEVADYGYGRRSCDTDPRFSLDACRMSFDDPFDEPRASWDGHLTGRSAAALSRMSLMSSVVEDAPAPVRRSDNQIPVEEPVSIDHPPPPTTTMPGGTVQTREYYTDSSSSLHRRRQSLERLSSIRRAGVTSGETEETKWVSNAKVSPATMDYFFINKLADAKDSNTNSSFNSAYRGSAAMAGKGSKKSGRWSKAWSIWGLIHWRGSGKEDEDDRYSRGNVVERSFSESWPELRREANGDPKGATFNRKLLRSNSSVSWRSSFSNGTVGGGVRSGGIEANEQSKKRRQEIVLERNRSARFSPSHFDNGGLLRFYLTPLTSGRRNGGASAKSRSKSSHSFAKGMPRLY